MSLKFDMTEIWTFFQNYENKNKGNYYSLASLVRKVPPREALSGLKKTTSLPSDTNDFVNAKFHTREKPLLEGKHTEVLSVLHPHGFFDIKHFVRPCKYRNIWCINTRKSSHSLKGFQSKKTPCSRLLIVKFYTLLLLLFCTLFKTQDHKNHTLFSGTYPYMPNMGVPTPPPPALCDRQHCWSLL